MQFLAKHAENPLPIEDMAKWDKGKLLDFLRSHQLDPQPVPNKTILLKLAKHMRNFVLACGHLIVNVPDGEETEAMGRLSLGVASPQDVKMLQRKHDAQAPKEKSYSADPQVSVKVGLMGLPA